MDAHTAIHGDGDDAQVLYQVDKEDSDYFHLFIIYIFCCIM